VVTLRDKLRLGRSTLPDALLTGWCIAHAMARGRAVVPGLVHGDLKPENMLMLLDAPHVADFGLARFQADLRDGSTALGTPPYSAPELRDAGAAASERTDIYSLGIMLVELVTGSTDYPGSDAWRRGMPLGAEAVWLLQLAQRCVSADPDLRPGSFAEIASTIAEACERAGVRLPDPDYMRLGMSHVMTEEQRTDRLAGILHSLFGLKQYELVVEQVDAIPAGSRTALLWVVYGDALSLLDRDIEAMHAFAAAHDSPGGDSMAVTIASRTALSAKRLGHHADAVKIIELALLMAKEPDELLELYMNLASVHYSADDYPLAFEAASRCLAIDTACVPAWRLLGRVFRFTNNYGRAIRATQRVIELEPHDPGNYEELGDTLLDIQQFEAFRDVVQNVIRTGGHPRELLARAIAVADVRSVPAEAEAIRHILRSNFAEDDVAWTLADAARRVAENDWTMDERGPQPVEPEGDQYAERMLNRMDPESEAYTGIRFSGDTMTFATVPVTARDRSVPYITRVRTARGIMLDIYFPQGTNDYVTAFDQMLTQVMRKPEELGIGSLSPTVFLFIRCACSAEILTNRPPGKSIVCRRCEKGFLVSGSDPSMAELVDRINTRMGLIKRAADYLILTVVELEPDQPAEAITQTAIEQRWAPLDPGRHAARIAEQFARNHEFLRPEFVYSYFSRRVDSMWADDRLTHESVYDLRNAIPEPRTMSVNMDLRVHHVHGLLALGELEAAERALIEQGPQPSDAELWSLLAQDASVAGLDDLAIRSARFSVQLAPAAVLPWATLAMILESRGKTDEARVYVENALRLDPADPLSRDLALRLGI
jgi:tetratricopeptide (TPR) repeat protein